MAVRRSRPHYHAADADVAVDGAGNVYLADFGNSKVRLVTNGIINTVAGRTNGAPCSMARPP